MAVLQRLNLVSGERLDLPDALNLDAFGNQDWTQFIDLFMTGAANPLIVSGFNIPSPQTYINQKSATVTVNIANGILFNPESVGGAGGFFIAPSSEVAQSVSLTANSTNFIQIDQTTFTGAPDTRAIWDASGGPNGTGQEFKQIINTTTFLDVVVTSNTLGFTTGKAPIAKIVTDVNGNVTSITDCRNLMFRLGTGGTTPNPNNLYGWPGGRTDNPVTLTTVGGLDPFAGSDKAIGNFKTWANAVMSRIAELTGAGSAWFASPGASASGSLSQTYQDALGSVVTSATGTGTFNWNSGTNTLTWSSDIYVQDLAGPYFFVIKAGSNALNSGDVLYLVQTRDATFSSDLLSWSSSTHVNGNPSGGSFALLVSDATAASGFGDWIKQNTDTPDKYVRIKNFYNAANGASGGGAITTAALAVSVELDQTYIGPTATNSGVYAHGGYTVTNAQASGVAWSTQNWWLATRWGTGTAQCYVRDGHMLENGDTRVIGYPLPNALRLSNGANNVFLAAPAASYTFTFPSALPATSDLLWVNSSGTASAAAFTSTSGGTFNGAITIANNSTFSNASGTGIQTGLPMPSITLASAVTPASGGSTVYPDSVSKHLSIKNSSGNSSPISWCAPIANSIAGITTTETIVAGGPASGGQSVVDFKLPANGLVVGMTLKGKFFGVCTSSAGNVVQFRVRIGTAGTTADGVALAFNTSAATSGTNISFIFEFIAQVSAIGATASLGTGEIMWITNAAGNSGISSSASTLITQFGTPTNFNSTNSNFVELTVVTAAATTSVSVDGGWIEWVS